MAVSYLDHSHPVQNRDNPVVSTSAPVPTIQKLTSSDLTEALRLGWADFKAMPSHALVLCIIYPMLGLVLARLVHGYSVLTLLFPLAAGFALIGPFAALGLYELSRRRETGQPASAWDAFAVLRSPSLGAMLGLGVLMFALFGVWIAVAQAIYETAFGYAPAATIPDFIGQVLTTHEGLWLIGIGCGVGLLFAIVALCTTVVAFPMMLDRHVGITDAMLTSMEVTLKNPIVMAQWGFIVAVLLVLGTIPFFLGLAVVLPLLGHATWHLYRRAVEPATAAETKQYLEHVESAPEGRRFAADFPVSIFPWARHRD